MWKRRETRLPFAQNFHASTVFPSAHTFLTTPERQGCPSPLPGNWIGPSAKKSSILLQNIQKKSTEGIKRIENESFELHLPKGDYSCGNFLFQPSTITRRRMNKEMREKTSNLKSPIQGFRGIIKKKNPRKNHFLPGVRQIIF